MWRFAKFWAVTGTFLMLCLLAGTSEWAKDSDKALRSQRSRSTRTTRLDADHDAYDHSGDLLSGSHASSLSSQASPLDAAPAAIAPATAGLPGFESWEPLIAFHPHAPVAFRGKSTSGRSPPAFFL